MYKYCYEYNFYLQIKIDSTVLLDVIERCVPQPWLQATEKIRPLEYLQSLWHA